MKTLIIIFAFVFIPHQTNIFAQWPNPENQMLSNSLSSFMYYGTKDPIPFSDPASLRDTNRRGQMSDMYKEESEIILKQSQYNTNMQRIYEHNYRLRNDPYYRYEYRSSLPRVRVVH